MTSTYGPFYISTYSPTSNTTDCSDSSKVLRYLYAPPNAQVELVETISVQNYGLFYVDITVSQFTNTVSQIYIIDGTTKYYLTNPNSNMIMAYPSNMAVGNYYWNIGVEIAGLMVLQTSLSETTNTNTYLKSTGLSVWLLNYVKNGLGNWDNNNYVFPDEMKSSDNPITTNNGKSSCNYEFTFIPVESATYSFVYSTNDMLQSDDLKMKINKTSNNITVDVFRSRCHLSGNSISCTKQSENLLSLVGVRSSAEPRFDYTYRVRAKVNKGIVSQQCANSSTRFSLYNLDANYIVVKYCGSFSLLTNEVTPSCAKMQYMIRKLQHLMQKCQ